MKVKDAAQSINSEISEAISSEKGKKVKGKIKVLGLIFIILGNVGLITSVCLSIIEFQKIGEIDSGILIKNLSLIFLLGFGISITVLVLGGIMFNSYVALSLSGNASKLISGRIDKKCACGYDLKISDKFCPKCGVSIKPICPKCGEAQEPGSKFCSNCGEAL